MISTPTRLLGVLVALPFAMLFSGCGGADGPSRYEVSGAVTFQGKPVPSGEIVFEPDGSKGNKGPGSVTRIKNGKFQTEKDKGVVGGPYIVRIIGFDGVVVHEEASDGSPLFPPYETTVEFPKEDTVKDFDVPLARSKKGP